MAKKKNLLHNTERAILQLLNKKSIPLTTNKIAEELGISYMTASKYLKNLLKKKVIEEA
jgi:response regulator of citrate/malate metabolism